MRTRAVKHAVALSSVVALLAGGMFGIATATAAQAAQSPGDPKPRKTQTAVAPEQAARFATQEKLDAAADRVREVSDRLGGSRFAGDRIDARTNTVTVYWQGRLPKTVGSVIDEIRETGVTVDVEPAKYTLRQMLKESTRLVRTVGSVDGMKITSAGPSTDGNSVEVGVDSGGAGEFNTKARQRITSELTGAISLHIVPEKAPQAATRFADFAPFWGGAYAETANAACTMGFGVAGNNGAARYLLTAAHCGGGQWSTGAGTVIGSVIPTRDMAHDAELILTNSGNAIYNGPSIADGDTSSGLVVNGAGSSHVGDTICEGGAFTGTVCGFVVAAVNQTINIGGFGTVTSMVQAQAPNHVAGIGNGDSGGPVYVPSGSGVSARGTMSAISGNASEEVDCAGVPTSSTRHCSWRWWYPDVTVQIATLGVHF